MKYFCPAWRCMESCEKLWTDSAICDLSSRTWAWLAWPPELIHGPNPKVKPLQLLSLPESTRMLQKSSEQLPQESLLSREGGQPDRSKRFPALLNFRANAPNPSSKTSSSSVAMRAWNSRRAGPSLRPGTVCRAQASTQSDQGKGATDKAPQITQM